MKLLFNPSGNDKLENRKIIGGNTTNLINLNVTKYDWATKIYKRMLDNFWRPEVIGLNTDQLQYMQLSKSEMLAYDKILSFLVFLDSIQTNNLPNVSRWITAPEIVLALAVQTMQEALHSQSYQYLIESVIPTEKRELIYDYWREDELLYARNQYIATIYQTFIDNQTIDNFVNVLIANYLLEGLYFYNGFQFFYTLASRHLMVQTSSMIQYIHKDELTHVVLFERILSEVLTTKYYGRVYELFAIATEYEIKWSNHVLGDSILGISKKTIEEYTKYLANMRLRKIGLEPLYETFSNPYKHLEAIANVEGGENSKVVDNFFESRVTSYQSGLGGFDDL